MAPKKPLIEFNALKAEKHQIAGFEHQVARNKACQEEIRGDESQEARN
ncbi:MAG: hypothetical protein ACJLTB_01885 [Algoriphagus aquaeductus]